MSMSEMGYTCCMLCDELARPVIDPPLKGAAPGGPKDGPRRHRGAEQGKSGVKVWPHEGLNLWRQRDKQSVALAWGCLWGIAVANEYLLQGSAGQAVRVT